MLKISQLSRVKRDRAGIMMVHVMLGSGLPSNPLRVVRGRVRVSVKVKVRVRVRKHIRHGRTG